MNPSNRRLTIGSLALMSAMGLWEGANQYIVYTDKIAGGLATVCRGHTGKDLHGNVLKVGTAYTEEECAKIDRYNAVKYSTAVLTAINVPINQPVLDALSLFAINVGINGMAKSRAVMLINAGYQIDGCKAIATNQWGAPAWSKSNGKYVQGLQNRRQYERDWCLTGAVDTWYLKGL